MIISKRKGRWRIVVRAAAALDTFALLAFLRIEDGCADAFAAALAKEKKAELVTGDPEFKALEGALKVKWLGKTE